MAERKGSMLAKSVSKHAVRAKEKFLQNLGKVDRTADEIFDEHLENFTRQQTAAIRLQKEFTSYIRCIRAAQGASKSLHECINEVYEGGWIGQENVYMQTQSLDMLWQDLSHKLADQVLLPLNTYCAQFPEMRKKIDKRSRKLVDYDSNRHNLQSLEGGGKKRDETKIAKAREQLVSAKRTYETLNSELHDDLPALYHSRILFLVNNLQTLFSAEQCFHSETSKVYSELEAIVDKLATDNQKQSYSFKSGSTSKSNIVNNLGSVGSPSTATAEDIMGESQSPSEGETPSPSVASPLESPEESTPPPPPESPPLTNGNAKINGTHQRSPSPVTASSPTTDNSETNNNDKQVTSSTIRSSDVIIPSGVTKDNLPPGVLYRVKAVFRYNREDVDELSFDVNEIIRVVPYDDPEEKEEGWLMGIKEGTLEKGMFPANFTKPI